MAEVHRNTDSRSCGATTVVAGNTNVYANSLLVSVDADPNSHGAGNLVASCNNVFVNSKMVVDLGDSAGADGLCAPLGGAHCSPNASSASGDVFVGD
jgi:hypothetical protein